MTVHRRRAKESFNDALQASGAESELDADY